MANDIWSSQRARAALLLLGLLTGCIRESTTPQPRASFVDDTVFKTAVFQGGTNGYHTFRIPAIVRSQAGTLLAFAEGRINSGNDYGDIDLVLRRSFDNGQTWGRLQVVANGNGQTKGNPVPIVDRTTGKVVLITTHNQVDSANRPIHDTRFPYVQTSGDDGATWSSEKPLPRALKLEYWKQYYTGPGHGIQLERGPHAGRLIVPASHIWGFDRPEGLVYGAHVLYSDDGGATWHLGATDDAADQSTVNPNENSAVELTDGRVYFTARDDKGSAPGNRAETVSADAGISYETPFYSRPDLIAPVVQGVTLRLRAHDRGDTKNRILLAVPAHPAAREVMSVRSSYDEGNTWETWETGKVIDWGPAAYSDLTTTADGHIGLLYESGDYTPYEKITFAKFSEAYLDTPNVKPPVVPEVTPGEAMTPDSSRLTNDAALKGDPAFVTGRFGGALELDGDDDHLVVPFSEKIDVAEKPLSLSLWFRYQETSGSHALAWAYRTGCCSTPQLWLRAEPETQRIRAYLNTATGSASVSSRDAYNDGLWHHAVLTKDDTALALWIDGQQVGSVPSIAGSLTAGQEFFIQGLHFGQRVDGANRMRGALDEIQLYRRVLSSGEIKALYRRNVAVQRSDKLLELKLETCTSC